MSPEIDSKESTPPTYVALQVRQPYLTYRAAKLHRLAESIPGILKRLQIRSLLILASHHRTLDLRKCYTNIGKAAWLPVTGGAVCLYFRS
jgi:hypothetical protein